MDQNSGSEDETATALVPDRGEMPFSQQFLAQHCRSGTSRRVPAAEGVQNVLLPIRLKNFLNNFFEKGLFIGIFRWKIYCLV